MRALEQLVNECEEGADEMDNKDGEDVVRRSVEGTMKKAKESVRPCESEEEGCPWQKDERTACCGYLNRIVNGNGQPRHRFQCGEELQETSTPTRRLCAVSSGRGRIYMLWGEFGVFSSELDSELLSFLDIENRTKRPCDKVWDGDVDQKDDSKRWNGAEKLDESGLVDA